MSPCLKLKIDQAVLEVIATVGVREITVALLLEKSFVLFGLVLRFMMAYMRLCGRIFKFRTPHWLTLAYALRVFRSLRMSREVRGG